jgi:hypothetical protein
MVCSAILITFVFPSFIEYTDVRELRIENRTHNLSQGEGQDEEKKIKARAF